MKETSVNCFVPILGAVDRWPPAILLTLAVALTSCGDSRSTVATPEAQTKPQPGIAANTDATSSPAAIATTETETKSPASPAESGSQLNLPPVETVADGSPSAQLPVADGSAPPTLTASVPTPTPEQLARWDITSPNRLDLLACHDWEQLGFVGQLTYTPDGRYFILGGTKLTLWTPTADQPEHVFLDLANEPDRSVTALAMASDGKWFCAGDSAGQLYVWNIQDRAQIVSKPLYRNDIVQIAISPSGEEIATLTYGNEVTTWDTQQWNKKSSIALDTNGVERIEYVADQRLVAAGETTSLWNTATGKLMQQLSPGRYQFAMAATPDRQRFAIGTEAGLQFWSASELTPQELIDGDFRRAGLTFSSDQRQLAACAGKDIIIRDILKNRVDQVLEASGPAIVGIAWLPASRLLVSVTELGRIRVWGDPAAAQQAMLQPLHVAVAMPPLATPANPAQLLAAIDVRTLPQLPGAKATLGSDTMLAYTAAGSLDEAKAFYHFVMADRGWQALPGNQYTPDYMSFARDGFNVFISLAMQDGQVNVSLTNLGNFDVRTLPKFDAADIQVVYEDETSSSYTTQADLLKIETNLLRRMQQAGWTAFSRLNSSHNEEDDVRDIEFSKQAIVMRVSIRKFPATPDRYTIQAAKFLGTSALPIPPDAGFVEADLVSGEPRLVASTTLPLPAAREFYDRELVAQGWLQRERGRVIKDDHNWLNYIRGQLDLTVGLSKTEDGRTQIRVGDSLENLSWQLKKQPAVPAGAEAVADKPQVGIEAADFPLLAGVNSLESNLDRKELRFKIEPATLLDIADQYLEQMAKLGWQPTREGIKSAEYVFLTFGKDKAEINLRANIREKVATVGIEGDGLLWSKPLPIAPKLVSYETWLRQNRHPASLDLLDTFEKEMRELLAGSN